LQLDVARMHPRMRGQEQDVVEGQREGDVGIAARPRHQCPAAGWPDLPPPETGGGPPSAPWHFLYFLPEPQGHGSLRPTFGSLRCTVSTFPSWPAVATGAARAVGVVALRRLASRTGGRGVGGRPLPRLGARFALGRLQAEEELDRLVLDALLHEREELEGLLLVLDERVPLTVPAQADAFLQVVDREEVVFPLLVDDLEHHELLVGPHHLGAEELLLGLVLVD